MEINKKIFFDEYRKTLDKNKKLSQKEVDDLNIFIDFVNHQRGFFSLDLWAYVFATTFHESAHTFAPITEYGNKAYFEKYDTGKKAKELGNTPEKDGDGYLFRGAGYVMITGRKNFERFSKILGLDLVKYPELALVPETSFKILIIGCRDGEFTGVSLSDFVENGVPNYVEMRRVINGTDDAELIAGYADQFLKILKLATK